ncbi:MAG: hypothetical protein KY443_06500 [Actinobacteria bacterium]|nr:hypothetical protein [Actinomycetota bacterium]
MTEHKSPLDQALDVFVYAPLGLALSARQELPRLAERGRAQADAQVTIARMVGKFAVTMGRREAEKAVKEVGERLEEVLGDFLGGRSAPTPPPPRPGRARSEPEAARAQADTSRRSAQAARAASEAASNGHGPSADGLAIPGYDSLAASQVVQRLAGLSSEELEAVREYEAATRGRKTILNRVAQLQAGVAP